MNNNDNDGIGDFMADPEGILNPNSENIQDPSSIERYFRIFHRWLDEGTKSSPRSVEWRFIELEREGLACLNEKVPRSFDERVGTISRPSQQTPAPHYGDSYAVAQMSAAPTDTAEEVGHFWTELYAQQVRQLLGDAPNDAALAAFSKLSATLKELPRDYSMEVQIAWMDRHCPEGQDACTRIRIHLYSLLDEIAEDHLSRSVPAATNGTNGTQGKSEQRLAAIEWKGSIQQLAWVLRELAEKGWVGYPAQKSTTKKWKAGDINASAFARLVSPHFHNVNENTLSQELKAEGGTVPAGDVVDWNIPKRTE